MSQLSINIDKEMKRPERYETMRNASKEPDTAALEPVVS